MARSGKPQQDPIREVNAGNRPKAKACAHAALGTQATKLTRRRRSPGAAQDTLVTLQDACATPRKKSVSVP